MTTQVTCKHWFQSDLLRQQAVLNQQERQEREILLSDAEVGHAALDLAERSTSDLQTDLDLALLQIRTETLRQVVHALARIDGGTYGICEGCGGKIAAPRLRALPFADRCRTCEEAVEAKQAQASQAFGIFRLAARPFEAFKDARG